MVEIIDAQIHLWTAETAPPHHRQVPFRMEQALREMDAAGVDRAINCPAVWDPQANVYAVEAARRHPDRFATLGWFDLARAPDDGFVAAFVDQPGMLGLRFLFVSPERAEMLSSGRLDWIWQAADRLGLPVGMMLVPSLFGVVGDIAARYPRMRLLIDHLGVPPLAKLPDAAAHLDEMVTLAAHPNIAVKATGLPSIATDDYPFASIRPAFMRVFDAFGPDRTFWGTDLTRLACDWAQCITLFTEDMPGLGKDDLEKIMGRAIRAWVGWS